LCSFGNCGEEGREGRRIRQRFSRRGIGGIFYGVIEWRKKEGRESCSSSKQAFTLEKG